MCISDYRRGMDWIIEFFNHLYPLLGTRSNIALSLIYTLYKSLGHAKCSQTSLVVSWQRIYNSLTVTTALLSLTNNTQILPSQADFQLITVRVTVRVTLRLAVYRQSVRLAQQAPWDSRPVILFYSWMPEVNSPYVTSSLTRGWVCRLQWLLVVAGAVILRSESRGTHDYILLSENRDSPTWRARSPYLYPPGTEWPGYTPMHWVFLFIASYDSQGYGLI
jgi:hypothetical protein